MALAGRLRMAMALAGRLRMAAGGMAMAQPRKTNQGVHPSSTNQGKHTRIHTPAQLLMADDLAQRSPNSSQDATWYK